MSGLLSPTLVSKGRRLHVAVGPRFSFTGSLMSRRSESQARLNCKKQNRLFLTESVMNISAGQRRLSTHRGAQLHLSIVVVFSCCVAALLMATAAAQTMPPPPIIGRWDLTVSGPRGRYPSWLEVERSGFQSLVGRLVGRIGGARPIGRIEWSEGVVRFRIPPQWDRASADLRFEGRLEGDLLVGTPLSLWPSASAPTPPSSA